MCHDKPNYYYYDSGCKLWSNPDLYIPSRLWRSSFLLLGDHFNYWLVDFWNGDMLVRHGSRNKQECVCEVADSSIASKLIVVADVKNARKSSNPAGAGIASATFSGISLVMAIGVGGYCAYQHYMQQGSYIYSSRA